MLSTLSTETTETARQMQAVRDEVAAVRSQVEKQSQATASLFAQVQAVSSLLGVSAGGGGGSQSAAPHAQGGLSLAAALHSSRKLPSQQRRSRTRDSLSAAASTRSSGRGSLRPGFAYTGGKEGTRASDRTSVGVRDRIIELTSLPLYGARRSTSPEGGGGFMGAATTSKVGTSRSSPPDGWNADLILYPQLQHRGGFDERAAFLLHELTCMCASGSARPSPLRSSGSGLDVTARHLCIYILILGKEFRARKRAFKRHDSFYHS